MTDKLSPADLKSLIDKDRRFQRAAAVLNNHWATFETTQPWETPMMTWSDIVYAQHLSAAGVLKSTIDLSTFAGVQQFLIHNQGRLTADVAQKLKEPFL